VVRNEFTREREKHYEFKGGLKKNLEEEKDKQRKKFAAVKAKYDKEGV
jgi:hypothetical protein